MPHCQQAKCGVMVFGKDLAALCRYIVGKADEFEIWKCMWEPVLWHWVSNRDAEDHVVSGGVQLNARGVLFVALDY